jgi:hypothetical protein
MKRFNSRVLLNEITVSEREAEPTAARAIIHYCHSQILSGLMTPIKPHS